MVMLSTAASTLWSERERKMVLLQYSHAVLSPFLIAWLKPVHPLCFQPPPTSGPFPCPRHEAFLGKAAHHPEQQTAASWMLSPKPLPDKSYTLIFCNFNSPLKHLPCLIYTHLKASAKDSKAQHAQMLNFSGLSQQTWSLSIRSCMVTCQQLLRCVSTLKWPANAIRRVETWIKCV